ncbi:MAG TPA: hypothetical protein VNB06_06875 [Thermoanaerobaculia bacterium]|nr:hypothetical protein [Thermoanaerobaculia bacterium]
MLRIERRERQLFWLAVLLGIALLTHGRWPESLRSERLASWNGLSQVIGPALLAYAVTTRLHAVPWLYRLWPIRMRPCWGVRRHPWIDLLLAIATGYLGFRICLQLFELGTPGRILAAFVGSALGLYLAAVLANPRSALVVVNCPASDCVGDPGDGVGPPEVRAQKIAYEKRLAMTNLRSPTERLFDRLFHRPPARPTYPLVWPFIFVAQVGGAVVWHLNGPTGSKVKISFGKEFQPFGPDRREFEAEVPGSLAIAPVVQGGCGHYRLAMTHAGKLLADIDPLGDDPPGDGSK